MEIMISLSAPLDDYQALAQCWEDQTEWGIRLRRMLQRRIGLENITGPVYPDHYIDAGMRYEFKGPS